MDEVYDFFDYISQKFGENSETLIKEYANSKIASSLTLIVICIVAITICVIGFKTAKRIAENEDSSYFDEDMICAGLFTGGIILSIMSFVVFVIAVPDLISYIVSPTGAVLREVLSKF